MTESTVSTLLSRHNLIAIALTITLVVMFCSHAMPVAACSCYEWTIRQRYMGAEAAFVGRVLREQRQEGFSTEQQLEPVIFRVERNWKGASADEFTVRTATSSSCDVDFVVGAKYVILAQAMVDGREPYAGSCGSASNYSAEVESEIDEFIRLSRLVLLPFVTRRSH